MYRLLKLNIVSDQVDRRRRTAARDLNRGHSAARQDFGFVMNTHSVGYHSPQCAFALPGIQNGPEGVSLNTEPEATYSSRF